MGPYARSGGGIMEDWSRISDVGDCSSFEKSIWLLSSSWLSKRFNFLLRMISEFEDILWMVFSLGCLLIESNMDSVLSLRSIVSVFFLFCLWFGRVGSTQMWWSFLGSFCEVDFRLRKTHSSGISFLTRMGLCVLYVRIVLSRPLICFVLVISLRLYGIRSLSGSRCIWPFLVSLGFCLWFLFFRSYS